MAEREATESKLSQKLFGERYMTIAEQIYEIVRTLPEAQAAKVLTFVESVQAKQDETAELASEEKSDDEKMAEWHKLLDSISGTWDDFPTLEEIRATEGQDAPRESW